LLDSLLQEICESLLEAVDVRTCKETSCSEGCDDVDL